MVSMQDRMNRLFSDAFTRTAGEEATGAWLPAVDIFEEGDNLILQAEVPGVGKEELDVRVENNILTLSGERRQQKEIKDEQFHRLERSYGKFVRSFTLPVGIDTERIKAEFKDGLLTLTLPKAEEAKPKRIKVLAA
jgi:HSP20 family protein